MSNRLQLKDLRWMLPASFAWSLLWFVPLFQRTRQEGHGYFESLSQMFFVQENPELLVGKGVDLIGSFWMVAQVQKMVLEGQSTKLAGMYAPFGFDLGENTGFAWFDALLAVPLAEWLGIPGFWNLHVLAVCTLSVFGLMLLFRSIRLPIFLVIPFAFLCFTNPFMVDELNLGRPTQIAIWPLAIVMAIFVRIQDSGFSPVWGGIAGVFMALGCLTYWFTGIAVGVCMGLLFLWCIVQQKSYKKGLLFACAAILSACAIILPLTWRMTSRLFSGRTRHTYTKLLGDPSHTYDWLGLSLQTEYTVSSWSELQYVFKASCQHPVFFALIIVCALLSYGRKDKRPWFWLWFFTLGMSLSSGLKIFSVHLPTGLALLEWVFPPMLRCQFEGRNVVVANMIGFVVVALTFRAFLNYQTSVQRRQWLVSIASVVGLGYAIYLLPQPATLNVTAFSPAFEQALALKKAPGAILDIPLAVSNYVYVHQLYHEQPMFGGMGFDTVRPSRHLTYTQNHPGIQAIERLQRSGIVRTPLRRNESQSLLDDGFRWMVVHAKYTAFSKADWTRFFGLAPISVEDDQVWLFDLDKK